MNQMLSDVKLNISKTFGKLHKHKDPSKKGAVKEFIAKLSKGLMLPIAMLPIAGIFLGVGAAIATAGSNAGDAGLVTFGNFFKIPGDVIFGALPVLFAIAIAIAFTKDSGPAALSAIVGFLVFSGLQAALIEPVIQPVPNNPDYTSVIGYNVLFYRPGMLSISNSMGKFGLETSLFGTVLGINQLSTSVFGGFIVGFSVAFLYNKFKNIQLPQVIGFFSGVRFIPIITFLALIPIALLVLMVWPLVGTAFYWVGVGLGGGNLYGFNSFIFGYIERSLVPIGLHHAFYSPLWYTAAGGQLDLSQLAKLANGTQLYLADGTTMATWGSLAAQFGYTGQLTGAITGDQSLWAFTNSFLVNRSVSTGVSGVNHLIQFSDFTTASGSAGVNIGQYLQGKYVFMMFGLPAAGAAMVMAAPRENRKVAGSVIISAAFTAFLTGITEPIEFTFLFLAPWLFWGFHAFFCALAFGLMNWIGLAIPGAAPHIGMTFSGGIIDWVIYGGVQIPGGSNAWWSLVFGAMYVPIYYFFFLWAIKKFNIGTPGRGDNIKLFSKKDFIAKKEGLSSLTDNKILAIQVISAYGGIENIKNVDACITKLRIQVAKQSDVDEKKLTGELGARGVIKPSPQSVYAVFGTQADIIKNNINEIIHDIKDNPSLKDVYFSKEVEEKSVKKTHIEKSSNETLIIKSPVDGKIVDMKNVPDDTFKNNLVGLGVAIEPTSGNFVAPIDGKLSLVFPTEHAYTFESKEGTQVLIHIGIDSINLKDKSGKELKLFTSSIKTGDKCSVGMPISKAKVLDIKKYAKSVITPVVILNESIFGREVKILKKSGLVKKGDPLFEIKPKKN